MKRLMLIAGVASALTFAGTAKADGSYLGLALYDFYGSNISITGGTSLNDKVSVHGQYTDSFDAVVRATAQYKLQDGFFALGGLSNYSGAGSSSGAIIGGGYNFHIESFPLTLKANYDTALDGFFSVTASTHYNVNEKFAFVAGYRMNTNGIDNELGLGIRIAF